MSSFKGRTIYVEQQNELTSQLGYDGDTAFLIKKNGDIIEIISQYTKIKNRWFEVSVSQTGGGDSTTPTDGEPVIVSNFNPNKQSIWFDTDLSDDKL